MVTGVTRSLYPPGIRFRQWMPETRLRSCSNSRGNSLEVRLSRIRTRQDLLLTMTGRTLVM